MRKWRRVARNLKSETLALYLAMKHPRTPWYARALAAAVVAYALSPIDLIPDPVPVLGYLDDLVLVPLGVSIVMRLVPADVMVECRSQAHGLATKLRPVLWAGAVIVVAVWVAVLALVAWLVVRALR